MNNNHYREDFKHVAMSPKIGKETVSVIEKAIEKNNAVGSLVGYYDEKLTIASVGDYFLNSLGYTRENFDEFAQGSLLNILYGNNPFIKSIECFKNCRGAIEGRMLTCDKTPVVVHIYKDDSVDADGTPVWVLAVRTDWEYENFELINAAIQSGPWYFDCDENGNIVNVYWSNSFRNILGFKDETDFPNKLESWSDLLHPDDKKATLERLRAAMTDKANTVKYNVEYRMKMQSGEYQWFRAIAEVTRRLNGSVRRIAGVFLNVEDEVAVLANSKQSEAFHRAFTKLNLCEYYVDLRENTFKSLKVESSLMTIFENSTTWDELIENFISNYVCEEYRGSVELFYNRKYLSDRLREGDAELSLECRIVLNGEDRWVRNVVMRGERGESQFAMIFLRDITEPKEESERRKKMLARNEAMEHLVHSMSRVVDHFAICDLENDLYDYVNVSIKSEYASRGKYADFVEFVTSKYKTLPPLAPMKELISPDYLQSVLTDKDSIFKFEYCSLDETVYRMATFIPLGASGGKTARALWTSIDITKAKLDEIAARNALTEAYLAAEKANHAKTQFLNNMSHDIRTPMNAIVGMTAIASANTDRPEKVKECLSKITSASRHLLGLINEVLDMARIESGRVSLAEEEFNLSELIDNLIAVTKSGIDEHRHTLDVYIDKLEHENVCGDSLRLQQVLINLMSNAVKYTPDGGHIKLSIAEKPNKNSGLGLYVFTVEDNGIGMTPEFQKVMFEPFTRADDTRTTKVQGTGLGMSVAKNIVSMMNGDIQVASAPNKGTKITVSVFLKLQNNGDDIIGELQNLPVLVVDDDRACCESTVAMLSDIGMAGEWVLSGEEAVELTFARHEENNDFYAVIIDWKMPGLDGIETTRRIRSRVGNDVTIIVLTSYDFSEIEEEARAAGVDAFIAKPIFRSRLTAVLKDCSNDKSELKSVYDFSTEFAKKDYSDKRILLVDDNELNREIVEEMLKNTNVKIDVAENGKIACDKVIGSPEGTYDLIFMDIQMPVMNGYEATAFIRGMGGKRGRIPIVAMTANAFAEDVELAKSTGMNDHIAKPLDPKRLNKALSDWLK